MKEPAMKRTYCPMARNINAFSLLEVLVSMTIVGIIGVLIFSIQTSSWKRSTSSNRTIVAGYMVERQIEAMRLDISRNQDHNFPPVDGSIAENGVTLKWVISDAVRPIGGTNSNTRQCDFTASWGGGRNDTLKVTTYVSKMF
jgi:prepilin-type N-terminal cleavage/methylation domain-containing protein